jgi:hypothetical protein
MWSLREDRAFITAQIADEVVYSVVLTKVQSRKGNVEQAKLTPVRNRFLELLRITENEMKAAPLCPLTLHIARTVL